MPEPIATPEQAPDPVERLLTAEDLARMFAVEPPTILRWSRMGTFPQPIKITDRVLRWRMASILVWLDATRLGGWIQQ